MSNLKDIDYFLVQEWDVIENVPRYDAVMGNKVRVKKKGGGSFLRALPGMGGKLKKALKKHRGKIVAGAGVAGALAVGAAASQDRRVRKKFGEIGAGAEKGISKFAEESKGRTESFYKKAKRETDLQRGEIIDQNEQLKRKKAELEAAGVPEHDPQMGSISRQKYELGNRFADVETKRERDLVEKHRDLKDISMAESSARKGVRKVGRGMRRGAAAVRLAKQKAKGMF